MRLSKIILGLAGMMLAIALVIAEGATAIIQMSLSLGWGMLAIIAFELVPLLLKSMAWHFLLPTQPGAGLPTIMLARWIRQSVSQLLPVAQIGGDAVGARVLYLRGVPGDIAGATTVVDLTLSAGSVVLLTLLGLLALVGSGGESQYIWLILGAAGLLAIAIVAFGLAQYAGMFRYFALRARFISSAIGTLVSDAGRLDQAVRRIYKRRGKVGRNLVWQLLSQISGAGEVLIACVLLGHPIGLIEAFALHSLSRAARAAAFMVPGGLGVQEGGIMLLAEIFGLPPAVGLSIALIKRIRELAIGVPGLVAWQGVEGAWRQKRESRIPS